MKPQPSLTISLATPSDAKAVTEILNQAAKYKLARNDNAWAQVPFTVEKIQERITKGSVYVARFDGVIVGTVQLTWEDEMVWGEQPPIAAYIHQLAVKDGYHGHHLGSKLLDWTAQKAISNNREFLRLDVPPENKQLRTYYEKIGFQWIEDKEIKLRTMTYTAALYEKRGFR